MADINLIKIDGKPIEKLIETVSAGIGILYKPKSIRNEADARAYEVEKLAEAEAKSSLIKLDTESQIADRARQRIYYQEIQRQVNLDNIIDHSTKYLNDNVSEQKVNEDWRTRFFNNAQDITSEELQRIWGKILANEINQPGTFSLRSLNIIINLSQFEAEIFKKIVCLVFTPLYILKCGNNKLDKYGIMYSDIMILKDIGLLYHDDNLHIYLEKRGNGFTNYQGKKGVTITYGNKNYFLHNHKSDSYAFPIFSLTLAGAEISKIFDHEPNLEYLDEVLNHLKTLGYEVIDM